MQHSNHPEGKLFLGFLFALFCGSLFGFVVSLLGLLRSLLGGLLLLDRDGAVHDQLDGLLTGEIRLDGLDVDGFL